MSERPTLTISAVCPKCKGKGVVTTRIRIYDCYGETTGPCPDCTDGTIRQAVSCAGCRIADFDRGALFCAEIGLTVEPDFGCLSWTAREG